MTFYPIKSVKPHFLYFFTVIHQSILIKLCPLYCGEETIYYKDFVELKSLFSIICKDLSQLSSQRLWERGRKKTSNKKEWATVSVTDKT